MNETTVYGYDGSAYGVGDRVELHPGTDLWMHGARYGTVVGIVPTPNDRVRVSLDRMPGRKFTGSADTFRLVMPAIPTWDGEPTELTFGKGDA